MVHKVVNICEDSIGFLGFGIDNFLVSLVVLIWFSL